MFGKRQFVWGPVALVLALLATATVRAQEPVAVLSVRSADALLGDMKYVLSAGGSPELGDLVDGLIDQMTLGKGLAGVDRSKPFGAYMLLAAGAETPDVVVFVPVTDNRTFREDLLAAFFPRQQEVAGGLFSIQSEGQQFYGKFANGHCFLTLLPAALNKLPDPAKIASTKYTIGFEADLSRMPDAAKDGMLERFEEAAKAQAEEQAKPDNELEARLRNRAQEMTLQLVRMLIKETDRMTIGVDINAKSKLVAMDMSIVAKEGSPLAESMASYAKTTSNFAGLISPAAAASVVFSAPLSNQLRDYLRDSIQSSMEQVRADIDKSERLGTDERKKAAKDLMDRLFQVVQATGQTGQVDGALSINAMPDNKAQIVGGGRVASGDELAKILDDFVKQNADSPEAQRIKLDVAKHGDARIHSISMELEGEAKEYLADGNVHIAIRGDAAFFAIGGDSLEAVKAAIDKSGKPVANRPPVSFRIQPSKFVAIFGKGDDPNLELARQAFSGDGDHISMELMPIDRGARLRFELGEGFLRFIALAVSQQLGE